MENSESVTGEVPVTIWDNCYDESWKTEITDESFAHPAKMARGLVRRIFDYLIESGRLTKGQIVCDPFGGIGTTGIEGASRGMRCFACELEPRFVDFAKANIELHCRTWEHFGDPIPVIVQGDSRKLCEVLGPVMASCIVSSPPYNLPMSQDHNGKRGGTRGTDPSEKGAFVKYGNTPGQLEGLPMGTVDAVVSSPPYASSVAVDGRAITDEKTHTRPIGSMDDVNHGYGQSTGQLGAMRPGSVDAVVSSPPYEGSLDRGVVSAADRVTLARERGITNAEFISPIDMEKLGKRNQEYGSTDGQIGNETGETFWSAARDIVAQCHQILRPGGICVWVTKDFVRNKQRVPFSADWVKLCQSQGFHLVEWIQASLVKTSESQLDLFGGDPHIKTTERKSFFRRLAEKKGSPRIDWEDVLVLQKNPDMP